jgi:hypothetical protein
MKTGQLGHASMLEHAMSARRSPLHCEIIRIDHYGPSGNVAISANDAVGWRDEVSVPACDTKRLNEATKFAKRIVVEQSGDKFTSRLAIFFASFGDGLWSTSV